MSMMDDVFDVRHALRRKPAERDAFKRIEKYLWELESLTDAQGKVFANIKNGVLAIQSLVSEKELCGHCGNDCD